jgi:hypothetical protein
MNRIAIAFCALSGLLGVGGIAQMFAGIWSTEPLKTQLLTSGVLTVFLALVCLFVGGVIEEQS